MTDLKTLQEKFIRSIVNANTNDAKTDGALLETLQPGGKIPSPEKALKVYQDGYPVRLTDALGECYEGVWSVLGDDEFFATAQAFIGENHSRSYNLSDYDERFAQFLENQKDLAKELPFLGELARFEWAFHGLFHKAPDKAIELQPEQLEAIGDESTFKFASSLQLFAFEYRSYSIWQARGQESEPFDFNQPEHIALYKIGSNNITTLPLEKWQWMLLHKLVSGTSLGETLEQANDNGEELTGNQVSQFFALIIGNKLIKEIS